MINIIKSLNYSAVRDKITWMVLFGLLVLPFLIAIKDFDLFTLGYYYSSGNQSDVYFISIVGLMIFSCRISMGDAGDNTLSCEIMAGHKRIKVFMGRVIAGILWGAVLITFMNCVPVVAFALINGQGGGIGLSGVLIRTALTFFPSLRLCTIFILFAEILRSAGKGICIGYVSMLVCAMIDGVLEYFFEKDTGYILAIGNSSILLGGIDSPVSGEVVIKTVAVSLVVSLVYTAFGYLDFRRKEL